MKVRGPFVLLRGSWTIKLPSNIAAINAMNFRDTTLKEKQNQISLTCTGLALECVNGLPLRAITFGSNQREQ